MDRGPVCVRSIYMGCRRKSIYFTTFHTLVERYENVWIYYIQNKQNVLHMHLFWRKVGVYVSSNFEKKVPHPQIYIFI